ncbi:MAG: metallophosphoesterase family protein, partial [Terrimicrobiaceae bacterium]
MLKPSRWLLACLMVFVYCIGCRAEAPGKGWFFVQISDTHWGARDGVSMTQRAAEMINALPVKVEFVVITGDVCSDSILKETVVKEGLEALKGLKAPLYYVPGNHDIV